MLPPGVSTRSLLIVALPLAAAAARPCTGLAQQPTTGTTVSGVVFDSLAGRPLAGALVQIAEAEGARRSRSADSDPAGRYAIPGIAPGTYLISFFHPKLDSLGLAPTVFRVDVRTDAPVRADLHVPGARRVIAAVCGQSGSGDSTGAFIGYVRSAASGAPVADGRVAVRWTELQLRSDGLFRRMPSGETATSSTGWFGFCGLPIGSTVVVRGGAGDDSSGFFEVEVPESRLLHRDVYVGRATRVRVPIVHADSLAGGDSVDADRAPVTELLRGNGRVRGRVTAANGLPLAGARVMVWGTGVEATTDDRGAFTLASLPGGTHTLDARAVGFAPARVAVDIREGEGAESEVTLTNLAITLDTVRVVAERIYTSRRLGDFERRRRSGLGRFLDEEEIEKRHAIFLSDLLRMTPGVIVAPGPSFGDAVYMRSLSMQGGAYCTPDVFLDGARIAGDVMPLNSLVLPSEVRALEVYARNTMVPAEFQTLSGCGVIVIWTGPRRTGKR